MCCIFDTVKRTRGWTPDPKLSENDNLFFAAVHFTQVFFGRYKIVRHNNEHDFDDIASDCSLEVYESAKRNIGKWDREKYRMDQYMYGRAWSVVGNFLQRYFNKKQRELLDVKRSDNRLNSVEYDVGTDELSACNREQGTRYTVWKAAPLPYYEKKLSPTAQEYLDYLDECEYLGIEAVEPDDFLTNKNSKDTDLRYLEKILNEENPNPRVTKKEVRVSLGKFKHSS